MPELSSLELFYPFALTLVACGFWSVFKLRPEMRSAFWFAISFASGAMAFGVEFFRFVIPDHTQALFGASFYNSMAACFVMGIILRASRKPPKLAIFSIAGLSALTIWILSLLDFHILIRVCLAQFTAGMLLLTALIYGRQRGQTLTDKAVLGIVSLITILLFLQPMIVQYTVGLPSTNAEYDASVLFLSIGAITTVSSILTATLLVREYVMVIINELKSIAARDKLTDILNRRGFEEYLPEIMDYAREGGAEVGLIVIDIDHFKAVNDTYGHGFGDDVIIALGHMLSAHKGDDGLAVRLGGEEFLLAVPVQSLDEACTLAELIRQRWSRQSHYFQSSEVRCTASFGVSLLREAESVSAAISRADQALYGAKQTGRNKVQSEADLQVAKLNYVAAQMQMANQGKFAMDADSDPVTKKKR